MIVRTLKDIIGSSRDVSGPGWKSRRLLLDSDGMGYSLHDTIILEVASLTLEYKHHFETCYCIEGEGNIAADSDEILHKITPYTVYALNQNDRHTVRAIKGDMRLICVFNPPLSGGEVHREDGSYAPVTK